MNLEIPVDVAAVPVVERGISPDGPQARIDDIDVIRGLALFGVLMMNLLTAYRVPFFGTGPPPPEKGLDYVVSRIEFVLLSGKAMTLFSILFGVGLSIFLERARARGPRAMSLLARRLFFLVLFGLGHVFLVWNGDILTSYGVCGLLALSFIDRRSWVLYVAVAVCCAIPVLGAAWPALHATAFPKWPGHYEEALRIYGTGSYLDILRFRSYEAVRVMWRPYILFGAEELRNMLVGILIWRSGILRAPLEHRRLLRWVAFAGILIGPIYPIYRWINFELYHPPPSPPSSWRLLFNMSTSFIFALGYGAGTLLLLRTKWRKWPAAMAPLGRMAFTNYLTQSIVLTTLFYGYGFGLLGKVGMAEAALIGIALYVLQGIVSTVWLRHFHFGPFEWAWRSLTYGQWQPFRRSDRAVHLRRIAP